MKRNKKLFLILLLLNLIVIFSVIFFPIESSKSEFVSGTGRKGYILEKNATMSQKFVSKLNNIEKILLMMTTTNRDADCNVNVKLLDDGKKIIEEKTIQNSSLYVTLSRSDTSTSFVYFHLTHMENNSKDKDYQIEISTTCDNIIKVQCYDKYDYDEDNNLFYNNIETEKKLGIRYSGTKKSESNFLYPIVSIILSLIIVLNRGTDSK